jgi:hypothetical protein
MKRLLLAAGLALAGCAPSHRYTDAEIPALPRLGDLMWSQAQVMDPAFKRIGAASYADEDWSRFAAGGARLKLTTARLKRDFSRGPGFDALADQLAARADDLLAAASAKEPARASAALAGAREACRACHKQFR